MKKVLIAVLICALAISCVALSGCGSIAGTYKVEKITTDYMEILAENITGTEVSMFGTNRTIILNEDGTGKLIIESDEPVEEDLLWERDGDRIKIKAYWINAFPNFTCKVKGDTLIEEFDKMGVYMERHYKRQ